MTRIYRAVVPDEAALQTLEQQLEGNRHLLAADDDPAQPITPDHMLFIRSLGAIIAEIDPRYNGTDFTIAHKWSSAEEECDDWIEFHEKLQIAYSLLRFRLAKIADIGRGPQSEGKDGPTYTVIPIERSILYKLRDELAGLTEIRERGLITPQDCDTIKQFSALIDAIDLNYRGRGCSTSMKGISIAERWYNAAFWDYEELLPDTPEDCAELFERLYTIIYTAAKYGTAVVIHSVDGQKCYPGPIYPDQIVERGEAL